MDYKKPQNLGDLVDNTFKLVGKTFKRLFTISALLMIPGSFVMTWGLIWFYSTVGRVQSLQQSGVDAGDAGGVQMALAFAALIPGMIIFGAATAAAKTASVRIVCGEITGEYIAWKDALRQAMEKRVWRLIGQWLLEVSMYIGIAIFLGIVAAITSSAGLDLGFLLLLVLFFSAFGVIFYCVVRWMFTGPALVWEDRKIFESFSRSGELINGNWWRVFGIMLLFSLLIGFSQMLITTPLMFVTNWNMYSTYFQAAGSSPDGQVDPSAIGSAMDSIGLTIGVYILVSSLFSMIIEPVYRSLMYFDLRARNNEFTEQETPRPFASYFGDMTK